jgi:hypothetical protein
MSAKCFARRVLTARCMLRVGSPTPACCPCRHLYVHICCQKGAFCTYWGTFGWVGAPLQPGFKPAFLKRACTLPPPRCRAIPCSYLCSHLLHAVVDCCAARGVLVAGRAATVRVPLASAPASARFSLLTRIDPVAELRIALAPSMHNAVQQCIAAPLQAVKRHCASCGRQRASGTWLQRPLIVSVSDVDPRRGPDAERIFRRW